MSLAETALQERAESAEPQTEVENLPRTGEYIVESTGAPQIPSNSIITIKGDMLEGYRFWLKKPDSDEQDLGLILSLENGDFAVDYQIDKSPARLQFRQAGTEPGYIFGIARVFPDIPTPAPGPMEDPPVTGVWGAETRPPRKEPYRTE